MVSGLLISAALAAADIGKLSWLVGTWEFRDYALPAAGYAYEETGRRTCDWALDGRYIRCQSAGHSRGKTRSYLFYLNVNPERDRVEMLSLFGNVADKSLKAGSLSPDGRTLDLIADSPHRDEASGMMVRGWSTIEYDPKGAYIWRSGHFPEGQPDKRVERFRDEVKRVANEAPPPH
jgi:hypothetical protein